MLVSRIIFHWDLKFFFDSQIFKVLKLSSYQFISNPLDLKETWILNKNILSINYFGYSNLLNAKPT